MSVTKSQPSARRDLVEDAVRDGADAGLELRDHPGRKGLVDQPPQSHVVRGINRDAHLPGSGGRGRIVRIDHHRDAAARTVGRGIPRDGDHIRVVRDRPEPGEGIGAGVPVDRCLGTQEPPDLVGLALDKELDVRQIHLLHP